MANPDRKVYVKVSGWLLSGDTVKVQAKNGPFEECVMYCRQSNAKSPFGKKIENGVEKTRSSVSGVIGHDLRLLFSKEDADEGAKRGLIVAERVFDGKEKPQKLGMVNIELNEGPHPHRFLNRLITSHWILPNRFKLFGAFNATINGDGDVELWKPSNFFLSRQKFFFTTRPEQAVVDELRENIWICNTLAVVLGTAAVGTLSGMVFASQKPL